MNNERDQLDLIDTSFLLIHEGSSGMNGDPCIIDLCQVIPNRDDFLKLSEPALGAFIIKELHNIKDKKQTTGQDCGLSINKLRYYHRDFRSMQPVKQNSVLKSLKDKVWDAWCWLRTEGYIIPGDQGCDVCITSKGIALVEKTNPDAYLEYEKFPRETLHRSLQQLNFEDFTPKRYHTAISSSFQAVEKYLKEKFFPEGSQSESIKSLLEESFKQLGKKKITDNPRNKIEDERKNFQCLFQSAFYLFRNHPIHASAELSSKQAFHQICLASMLLYLIDEWFEKKQPEISC